jgi:hypothetical protein
MSSMLPSIVPKSDQLNADDLLGGRTLTIKITKVSIHSGEQPVALHYEGDNGKPYKPGKSMCRVLVFAWGADANLYVGRSLTLYRDDTVKFGGILVGGIRISHMSHINEARTMALTATRGLRKPFTVKPLMVGATAGDVSPTTLSADDFIADMQTAPTLDGLKHKFSEAAKLFKDSPDFARIHAAKESRKKQLTEGIPL